MVSLGVPQGSILGPLLFILYINGISNLPLSPNSSLILYAGDMLLYKPIDSSLDYSSIQTDLNVIYDWLSPKLLNLNPSKSKFMFFSHKPSSFSNSYSPLQINRNDLQCIMEFWYLGVITHSISFLGSSHLIDLLQITKNFRTHLSPFLQTLLP